MRKSILLFSMLVILLMLVACAPKMSDQQLGAEISKLSPEEQQAVISKDSGALTGNAKASSMIARLRNLYQSNPTTCNDTDADAAHPTGKDYFKKGTLTWSGGPFPGDDVCGNEQLLRENYCSGIPKGIRVIEGVYCNEIGPQYFPNSGAWFCVDGACTNKLADLKIDEVSFKMKLNQTTGKDDIEYVANVRNIGIGDAGPFSVKFEPAIAWANPQAKSIPSLAAGAMYTITGTYSPYNVSKPGQSVCPGAHDLKITADNLNWVLESEESNNGYLLEVTC